MGEESKIENAVAKYARKKGFWVRKFKSPGNRGAPDKIFMSPKGDVFFIEFKAPGKEPTALQHREIAMIKLHKGHAFWTDSVDGGKAIVDRFG